LRKIIASASFATASGELSVSVGIGFSNYQSADSRALKDMLAEADAALYDAKQTGRNKVVCFGVEGV